MFGVQQCGCRAQHARDGADVTQQGERERRDARCLQQLPQGVASAHVAYFVREHRDQLVICFRELHQFVGHDDDARRQRERIGADEAAVPEFELIFMAIVEWLRHVHETGAQLLLTSIGELRWLEGDAIEHVERAGADGAVDFGGHDLGRPVGDCWNSPVHERDRHQHHRHQ
jgi:hypothetical protein